MENQPQRGPGRPENKVQPHIVAGLTSPVIVGDGLPFLGHGHVKVSKLMPS